MPVRLKSTQMKSFDKYKKQAVKAVKSATKTVKKIAAPVKKRAVKGAKQAEKYAKKAVATASHKINSVKFEDGGKVDSNDLDRIQFSSGTIEPFGEYYELKLYDAAGKEVYKATLDGQAAADAMKEHWNIRMIEAPEPAPKTPRKKELEQVDPPKEKEETKLTRDQEIAATIVAQLGGRNRLHIMTGAYDFFAVPSGVRFKIKNAKANYIKIVLGGNDLYKIEIGRIRGLKYTIVYEASGLYADMLKPVIEKYTGMYLSFKEGGIIENEDTFYYILRGGEWQPISGTPSGDFRRIQIYDEQGNVKGVGLY